MTHKQDHGEAHMQIGDVAEQTGLSLRTIRYYEEAGLIVPSTRTSGGFRLYTTVDSDRLNLIKRMKPLGFSLDEMRDLLWLLDELTADTSDDAVEVSLRQRIERFAESVDARCELLREQLSAAGELAELLRRKSSVQVAQGGLE